MTIVQVDLADRKQVREFVDLPYQIYRECPQWVPPLAADEQLRLNPKRYPYYRHSAAAFFLAYVSGRPAGRLAVLDHRLYNEYHHEKTAFFYLFECEPDGGLASELFTRAFQWAGARGLDKMVGPKGFTALDGLGLLVKGFEHRPAFGIPYNLPYYPDLVEGLGFQRAAEILSGYLSPEGPFPERITLLAERLRERRDLAIAHFRTRRELRSMLLHLKDLYNAALEGTEGGIPITEAEVRSLADQMLWFADPSLIKMVMKADDPVGFLLAYPDISGALQKTQGRLLPLGWITILHELRATEWININGAGMLPPYRGSGGTAVLYSEMFKSVKARPRTRHVEVVQIGVENTQMQRELSNFGIEFYKVHRTYQRPLN